MVRMTRSVPEIKNGPTTIDVQEQDVKVLEGRGWVVFNKSPVKEEKKPVKEETTEELAELEPVESPKQKKNKF